jgi:hypothetical protein
MNDVENLPRAYKIDDIFIITKVYPYNEIINERRVSCLGLLGVSIEQDNEIDYCKKNLTIICKCPIYLLGYIMCSPCIFTCLCINISFNICRRCQ